MDIVFERIRLSVRSMETGFMDLVAVWLSNFIFAAELANGHLILGVESTVRNPSLILGVPEGNSCLFTFHKER